MLIVNRCFSTLKDMYGYRFAMFYGFTYIPVLLGLFIRYSTVPVPVSIHTGTVIRNDMMQDVFIV